MALRVVTVQSAGGDYSSLNAAYVGELGDLTAAGLNRQLEIDCYNVVDTTAADSGAGWTTDATHTVLTVAVDNHHGFFGGVGGAAAYSLDTSGGTALKVRIDFATVRGLSLRSTFAFGAGFAGIGASVRIERSLCITSSPNGVPAAQFNGDGTHAENCLFVPNNGAAFSSLATGTVTLSNCTGYNGGLQNNGGGVVAAINCAAAGTQVGGFLPGTWTGSSNCASTDGTSPSSGSGHRINQTISLFDPANGDYRVRYSDAGVKGYGTDLSADPTYPFSVDIANTTRTVPWDIGAFVAIATPIKDVYLRTVPSDTNTNDVRLYPFTADAAPAVSIAIGTSAETSADAILAERISAAVTTTAEQSSAETLTERYTLAITTAAEESSAATMAERVSAAITTANEQASAATLTERYSAAITTANEQSSASSLAERVSAAITTANEQSSAATLVERITASVATASEQSSDATLVERLSLAVASANEAFSDAVESEAEPGTVASSTEAYSDASMAVRISLAVESSAEASSGATLELPVETLEGFGGGRHVDNYFGPPQKLRVRVASGVEASSDAVMGVRPRIGMAVASTVQAGSQAILRERIGAKIQTETFALTSNSVLDIKDGDDEEIMQLYSAYQELMDDPAYELIGV